MSEVQGTIEFSVQLHKFHNVDLFQRGYYHVRASIKTSARIPHRLVATLVGQTDDPGPYTPCVYDNVVYSRVFQILYRNEDIDINDVMAFKVHLLLDGERVEDALSEVDFQLKLDLHFTDSEQQLKDMSAVPLISSRTLGLHFHPTSGLHHHVPVMFDYFHLSVISVTVHGSLVALHQPLISFARPVKASWLGKSGQELVTDNTSISMENLVFGAAYCKPPSSEGSCYVPSEDCIQHAYKWHKDLCQLLLTAYTALGSCYANILKEIPDLPHAEIEELPTERTLSQLCNQLQLLSGPEEIMEQISKDLAWLRSQLLLAWSHFLETVTLQPDVTSYLMQEHHTLRVRRFSEAFFYTEHEKPAVLTFQENLIQSQSNLSTEIRSSEYLSALPPLPIECLDIDGDWTSIPIIFEDRFVECPRKDYIMDNRLTEPANENECESSEEFPSENIHIGSKPHFIQTTTVHENVSFEKQSIDAKAQGDCSTESPEQGFDYNQEADSIVELGFVADFTQLPVPPSEISGAKLSLSSPDKDCDQGSRCNQEPKRTPGVTYIEVKPQSQDQYKGETVLIVGSQYGNNIPLVNSEAPQSERDLINSTNKMTTYEHIALHEISSMKNELISVSKNHKSRQGSHILLKSSSTELIRNSTEDTLMVKSCSRDIYEKSSLFSSGCIKRSSSVISDSGIESEPSSVACCDVHNRTMDLNSDKDLLLQMSKQHWACRNSLEGDHTESNTSLPSGIQASLASINSLPFEEEDREMELSKLTKSVSAPQISSQDETLNDLIINNKLVGEIIHSLKKCSSEEKEEESQTAMNYYNNIANGIFRELNDTCNTTKSPESSLTNILIQGWIPSSESGMIDDNIFNDPVVPEAEDIPSVHPETILCDFNSQDNQYALDHANKMEHEASSYSVAPLVDVIVPTKEIFQDFSVLHDIELSEDSVESIDQSVDNYYHELYSIDKEVTDNRTDYGSELEETRASMSTVRVLERRKGVELVNLSVSCTATCLPFSSMQNDTPVIPGFSTKQALFPITRQPLGTFEVNSSNSNTDEESNERMLSFHQAKDKFRKELKFEGFLYSDQPVLASDVPYFPPEEEQIDDGIHLVVCVHGLDGNSADLRLVKTFLELGLPGANLDFLMSEKNQTDTFADFDAMTDRLIDEIVQHIQLYNLSISRISFIGHSLGNIIIRSVLTRPRFRYYLNKLHTFLSLSGPHLGTLYSNSTLVNTGLWLMQKLKKSGSLLQLTFRDNADLRKCFLYQLSQKPGLQYFKNVVLVASPQDRYVPFHSARIEMCKNATKDRHTGPVYTEMLNNLLQPVIDSKDCTLIRHNVFHALPNTANTLIGRAAHIAVLDSELFLEKFFLVAGLGYFK
ncbi:protein FAM135B [Xenopus laevis]|uniref:Protein FAM135B n=1 Tax=Xenopus laevis TaxID=8355 RepID=A0A8J1L5U5_XENLA|nr:protein FAM135B [Xenopus laevis]